MLKILNAPMFLFMGFRLHHLITNSENLRFEIDAYRSNWVNHTGALAEVWMMHNWSGGYEGPYERKNMVAKGFSPQKL